MRLELSSFRFANNNQQLLEEQCEAAHRTLDTSGFIRPVDEHQVYRDAAKDHQGAYPRLNRTCNHRYYRHEQTAYEIDDGPEQIHFYRPLQVRTLPTQPRQTQHCHSYAQLKNQFGFTSRNMILILK